MNSFIQTDIQRRLFTMQDLIYRDFQARLMPTVDKEQIIGVRTPLLRALAKELSGSNEAAEFMRSLPHRYYEENNLHAFLIEHIKDYEQCAKALDEFLPYVDNWATCDSMSPKIFRKHLPELLTHIKSWINSDSIYTIRYGIGMLMRFYLDESFLPEYAQMVADVHSCEYYVNMMRAWYFATALAKQYDTAVVYLELHLLDDWTHNRTIQKAIESLRISDSQKSYLRTLRL